MILHCGGVFAGWRPSSRVATVCLVSPEQLRQQLDSLNMEADAARTKASNARSRLMRLSEAAEKFRRQASTSVQTGKEDDARKLLFQKKQVMQAMEKLKSRIELLDELSAKLNEGALFLFQAISVKEGLLIGNIALDIEVNETEPCSPIRIITPKEADLNSSYENQHPESDQLKFGEHQEVLVVAESESSEGYFNNASSFSPIGGNDTNMMQHLREISSFEDFMTRIDQKLHEIEEQLETFLKVSSLLLESNNKPENSKVQHATDVLKGVRNTRERIALDIHLKTSLSEPLRE
ncbi:hypothetical protein F511_31511 [Dorcoceras hygrometricum]|uniref:Uncharacterized protein n=1 Tax=Dorcoceras hygrometricum TaxID=472368 RepID=A0A2Z7D2J0_9LAMI|nr:hypothetical protein F511_31511 [Dorcoceras hygrometricum]